MNVDSGNAPSWLFSFVDLAFLLLIAMTQVGGNPHAIEVRGVELPKLSDERSEPAAPTSDTWQVRVHPASSDTEPFELFAPGQLDAPTRLSVTELEGRLQSLHRDGGRKPVLAPHADSRSQDMLDAASTIESLWPSRRRALVRPVLQGS